MSYTPGPWIVGSYRPQWAAWSVGPRLEHGVARLADVESNEDDARLIAAAPEMLAALKAIQEWFTDLKRRQHEQLVLGQTLETASENWETMWDEPLEHPLDLQIVFDAIAKAEGR